MTGEYTWLFTTPPICFPEWPFYSDPFAALAHAEGATLHRLRSGGIYDRRDATEMLRTFARLCAQSVMHLWDAPEVAREWGLHGGETRRIKTYSAASDASVIAAPGDSETAQTAAHAAMFASKHPPGDFIPRAALWASSATVAARSVSEWDAMPCPRRISDAVSLEADIQREHRARFNAMAADLFEGAGE